MKVLCIDAGEKKSRFGNLYHLVLFNVYNVIETFVIGNDIFYLLAEFPPTDLHTPCANSKYFIPLSEIDEMELVNEKDLSVTQ